VAMRKKLLLAPLLGILLVTLALSGASLLGRVFDGAQAAGEYGTMIVDVGPLTGNSSSAYGTIDLCKGNVAADSTFDIDIIIDSANDLAAPSFVLNYDETKLEVTARAWIPYKMGDVPIESSDARPDTDGEYMWSCARGVMGGVNGDGVIVRITLHALPAASGTSDLYLCTTAGDCPNAADSDGDDHFYPEVLVHDYLGSVRVAIGEACPPDSDGDTAFDDIDNCPNDPNPDQANNDGDGMGDVCDPDDDNDGLPDTWEDTYDCTDSLVADADDDDDLDGLTHAQEYAVGADPCDGDSDDDGLSDGSLDPDGGGPIVAGPDAAPADPDRDGDDVSDGPLDPDDAGPIVAGPDNCPDDYNPAQTNTDVIVNPPGDSLGDACDPDDDDDGILDDGDSSGTIGDHPCTGGNTVDCDDNCRLDVNPDQADGDGDGIGDVCDFDLDGDGIPDSEDNCPQDYNPGQEDLDKDGIGDVCDPDRDGDGIDNVDDNCPDDPNPDQEDMDEDDIGDVCDPDRDGDGIDNVDDNCPDDPNPGQEDVDKDGIGDVCDPDDDNDGVPDVDDECPAAAEDDDGVDDDGCPDSDPQVTAVAKLYADEPVTTITIGPSTPAQVEVAATIYNGNPGTSYEPTSVKLRFSQTSPALPTPSLCDPGDPEYDPNHPLCDPDADTWINARELELGSDPNELSSTPESLLVPGTCSDDIDNDGVDGKDAADPKCQDPDGDGVPTDWESSYGSGPLDFDSTPEHAALPWTCFDGVDNDLDGSQDQPGESDGPDDDSHGDCSAEQFDAMGTLTLTCYSGFIREAGDILSQIFQPDGTIVTDLEFYANDLAVGEERNLSRTEIIFCPLLGDAIETNTVEILEIEPPVRDENNANNSGSQALNVHVTADLDGDGIIDSLDTCPNDPEDLDACSAQEIADSGYSSPPACYDGCPDSDIVVSNFQLPVPNPEVLQNRMITGNEVLFDITNTGVLDVPADVRVTLQQLSGPECISRWDGETHVQVFPGGTAISEREWQESTMAPGETRHISATYNITCTDNPGPYRDDFVVFAEPLPLVLEENIVNNIEMFTSYVTVLANADGDNVPDATDQCPDEPEDEDGCGDSDGCPEDDADGDGIPDDEDPFCNIPDTDHDGVNDPDDACLLDPEIIDDELDDDGCPDSDARVVDVTPHSQSGLVVDAPWTQEVTATYQNGNETADLKVTLLDYMQLPECTGNWTPQAGDTFMFDDVDTNGDTVADRKLSIIERTYTDVAPFATIELTRERTMVCSEYTYPPPCADDDVIGTVEVLDPVVDPDLSNNVLAIDHDLCAAGDSDSDGTNDEVDNCLLLPNPDQANNDGDSHGDACDNCPNSTNEDQADNDGDGIAGVQPPPNANWGGDVCDADDDNDSCIPPDYVDCPGPPGAGGFFRDDVELFIGSDPFDACADDTIPNNERGPAYGEPVPAWPPDFNDTGKVTSGDLQLFAQHYASAEAYDRRYDLNGTGKITTGDLQILATYWQMSCSVG
jgi:hypothetical protein